MEIKRRIELVEDIIEGLKQNLAKKFEDSRLQKLKNFEAKHKRLISEWESREKLKEVWKLLDRYNLIGDEMMFLPNEHIHSNNREKKSAKIWAQRFVDDDWRCFEFCSQDCDCLKINQFNELRKY